MPIKNMKKLEVVQGWGRTPKALSRITCPETYGDIISHLRAPDLRGILATGLFRSYGDSALNSGGVLISTKAFDKCEIDPQSGVADLGAGLSIRELEKAALKYGFFPPVVPGTGFVSIGGAIAADVHGKSHHITGNFSSAVRRITLLFSDSSIRDLYPDGPTANQFWATVGGMGLTGIILGVELQLIRVKRQSSKRKRRTLF
jgi:decaprenylphospho-beta-D-ribofuranose 2-oxidase